VLDIGDADIMLLSSSTFKLEEFSLLAARIAISEKSKESDY